MQAENALLSAVASYLTTQGGLTPTPAQVGAVEPVDADELPAVVLSIEESLRAGGGLGARTSTVYGALVWEAQIDLAAPYLDGDTSFSLVSTDRKQLILPHGGLVRSDGTTGQLSAVDIGVMVAGVGQTLVSASPAAGQYTVDPTIGVLSFGAALPTTGLVAATYYLGQWEQQVQRISSVLRVDAVAGNGPDAQALSEKAIEALLSSSARKGITRLLSITLKTVGSVTAPETLYADGRRRSVRFAFDFEAELNEPASSGGIIQRIPMTTHLSTGTVDPETGEIVQSTVTEEDEV